MGSQESKMEQSVEEDEFTKSETEVNESVPSSPILTPLDPRSPSFNIARTPLEVVLGSETAEDTPDDKTGSKIVTNKNLPEIYVLGIDPRSPTVEFNRTPIVIGTMEKSSQLQNKNFDNVRKSLIQTTPTRLTGHSPNKQAKLLSSKSIDVLSPVRRKSCVGYLETNVDFIETDLDSVCKQKIELNQSLPVDVDYNVNIAFTNKLKDQMKVFASDLDNLQIVEGVNESMTALDDDVLENGEEEKVVNKAVSSDNIPVEKSINVTAQVKDFDKKLTNLIYQDENEEDNKVLLKLGKVKDGNRTPLGVRNSNGELKKTTNRLKVNDKPRKIEGSKIPVFKDNHSKKIGIQCENTPPRNKDEKKVKPKMSQWDGDKTLVI